MASVFEGVRADRLTKNEMAPYRLKGKKTNQSNVLQYDSTLVRVFRK